MERLIKVESFTNYNSITLAWYDLQKSIHARWWVWSLWWITMHLFIDKLFKSFASFLRILKELTRKKKVIVLKSFYLKVRMNQQSRDMNSFLAEQAMLLANNSVSLTQISRPVSLSTNNNNKQSVQNQPSPVSTPLSGMPSSPASSSTSNLSKYSQLLLVLEEMGKDIR